MKPNKNEGKSETQPIKNECSTSVIDDLLKKLREKGLSVISAINKNDMKKIANWANEVFNDYTTALADFPMKIKSIEELPCSKQDIKLAIKILLPTYLSKGSDDMVDLLKDRYVRLSAFQEISKEDKKTLIRESHEIEKENGTTDRLLFPNYYKYIDLMVAEQNALIEDITSYIEDLPYLE
ncbi:MAG: hypothetical protein PVG96_04310 [Desulfobacterales bacterium]|jgi:hypothetical protein